MENQKTYFISFATYMYDNTFWVIDNNGQEIKELSGDYSEEKLNEIIKNSDSHTFFKGFDKLRCIACDLKNKLIFKKNEK